MAALAFEGGLAAVALVAAWILGLPSPLASRGRFHWGAQLALGVAATLPLVAAFLALERFPSGPLRDVRERAAQLALGLFRGAGRAELLLVSGVAGLGEELLFRGLLLGGVAHGFGVSAGVALLGSSVAFGLAHPITRAYALLAAGVGLYFGGLYLAGGGVIAPLVAHALYDFFALDHLLRTAAPAPLVEAEATRREGTAEPGGGEHGEGVR